MSKRPLCAYRADILQVLRRIPNHWSADLASAVERMLDANERRALAAARQAHPYSDELREHIANAFPTRLIGEPGAAAATLRRIQVAGPEAFGLRREPDIETIRSVGRELENMRDAVIETRRLRDVQPRLNPSSTCLST